MRMLGWLPGLALLVSLAACADKPLTFRPPAESRGNGGRAAGGSKVENPRSVTLDSGVRITDLVIGKGREATRGSVVQVHYKGTLPDGVVFDQSDRSRLPSRFVLSTGPGGVIAGFVDGIAGMHEGGSREIRVPWQLGYGDKGTAGIPARSNLTFVVDLVEVK
jgi:FKBP-type peptidyl-prolyl cis-trans isomerase